jgi:hypothetical protein
MLSTTHQPQTHTPFHTHNKQEHYQQAKGISIHALTKPSNSAVNFNNKNNPHFLHHGHLERKYQCDLQHAHNTTQTQHIKQ